LTISINWEGVGGSSALTVWKGTARAAPIRRATIRWKNVKLKRRIGFFIITDAPFL
jgi:hypothetical protein